MTNTGRKIRRRRRNRFKNYEEVERTNTGRKIRRRRRNRFNRKRRQLEKQGSNWSELPRDILACIIERLNWMDRIRIRAVCTTWSSFPNSHIPTIDDEVKVPWAMTFKWKFIDVGEIHGECRLLDPLSRAYVAEESVRGEEYKDFIYTTVLASVHGWVLFQAYEPITFTKTSLFLYSPFTTEVIKLPKLDEPGAFRVGTFSLNANSPKCVVFLLRRDDSEHKIRVNLCSPGDDSWKNFEFNNQIDRPNSPMGVVYAYGVFFCVFGQGQLGAFFVEHEEWFVLTAFPITHSFCRSGINLIWSDAGLLLLDTVDPKYLKLFKFDFSEMCWMYENSLNNSVLFIGCTSFSAPAVEETSQLANTIFFCNRRGSNCHATAYGSTPPGYVEKEPCGSGSLLYRKCLEAAKCGKAWIQPPIGSIWRANDLINAA